MISIYLVMISQSETKIDLAAIGLAMIGSWDQFDHGRSLLQPIASIHIASIEVFYYFIFFLKKKENDILKTKRVIY